MDKPLQTRRTFLRTATATAVGTLVVPGISAAAVRETVPTEDLMREHGVLRRALLVYRHCASLLRSDQGKGLAQPLYDTAYLFRKMGEDYHERELEEKHVFPILLKEKPPVSKYPGILTAQHEKGREVTSYVQNTTHAGTIASGSVKELARALDAFVLMYGHHAAFEDTVVFPAWKKALSDRAYKEMEEIFESSERRMLGENGFETQVSRIESIESRLELADLSQFTVTGIGPQP